MLSTTIYDSTSSLHSLYPALSRASTISFQLAITKTSGNLGWNQQHKKPLGSFGGTDKQKFQAKLTHHYKCGCFYCQVHSNCTATAFLLDRCIDWLNTVSPKNAKHQCGDSDPLPAHFGNGQFTSWAITLINFTVKPWPNGTPNSSQLEPSSQLWWSWVSFGHPLGLSWLEWAWIWSSSNFRPTRAKVFTVWPPQPTLAKFFCYCYVAVRLYSDNWMVFLRAGSTWRYRLATRRCQSWFCNLARVVGSTVWPGL